MMNFKLLAAKFAFQILHTLFPPVYEENNRILCIKLQHIGDTMVFTPALRALKKKFPDKQIYILAESGGIAVLKNNPYIDGIIEYRYNTIFQLIRLILRLRRMKFGTVLSFFNEISHRFGIISFLTGAKKRIGYNDKNRGIWYSDPVYFSYSEHRIHSCLHIIKTYGVPEDSLHMDFFISGQAKEIIKSLPSASYAVIHPASKWQSKYWPIKNWITLINMLQKKGILCIIAGTEDIIDEICDNTGAYNLRGRTTLEEAASVIEKSKLFVGLDSGLMHIAASFGKKTVILTSAQDIPSIWTPLEYSVVIRKNVPCSPCFSAYCRFANLCMNHITPDEVFSACVSQLAN